MIRLFALLALLLAVPAAAQLEAPSDPVATPTPEQTIAATRDAGDDEVRTAYRRLIREHHPDLLVAQGMPQDFIDIANQQMASISRS